MLITAQQALIVGAICNAAAALAHLGCIVWGAPVYRFMGAGERMGRAVALPLLRPAFPENSHTFWLVSSGICLFIGLFHLYGVLGIWHML